MAFHQEWSITLKKLSERQLGIKVVDKNVDRIIVETNTRGAYLQGFHLEKDTSKGMLAKDQWEAVRDGLTPEGRLTWEQVPLVQKKGVTLTSYVYLTLVYHQENGKPPANGTLASMLKGIFTRAASHPLGRWELVTVDGAPYAEPEPQEEVSGDVVGYAELTIPEDFEDNFSHLFGLEAPVGIIKASLEAGIDSEWVNRFHVALIGDPGCGKSDICRTLKRTLGDEAVMEFDATNTTGAGAIKQITEMDVLPRVLIVEEIEKQDQKQLAFFLAFMDDRAEIRKTTFKTQVQRDTRILVICTVNNMQLFSTVQSGALVSRFGDPVFFHRPSREQLQMILEREVDKVQGDREWIKPTLDWCDARKITDPRRAISLCLRGKGKWLTGEWQQMLLATSPEAYHHDDERTLPVEVDTLDAPVEGWVEDSEEEVYEEVQ